MPDDVHLVESQGLDPGRDHPAVPVEVVARVGPFREPMAWQVRSQDMSSAGESRQNAPPGQMRVAESVQQNDRNGIAGGTEFCPVQIDALNPLEMICALIQAT